MISVDHLPVEILSNIFNYLDLEDVLNCMMVNERWRAIASDDSICSSISISDLNLSHIRTIIDNKEEDSADDQWRSTSIMALYSPLSPLLSKVAIQKLSRLKEFTLGAWESIYLINKIVDIAKSSPNLKSFTVDVSYAIESSHLFNYLKDLPKSIINLSIRNQIFTPQHDSPSNEIIFTEMIDHLGENLLALDLTGTLITDSQLLLIGNNCKKLQKLILTRLFNINSYILQEFVEDLLTPSLQHLCIRSYSLKPETIINYIKLQNNDKLSFLDIQSCDIFTLRDIQVLTELTSGTCQICHSARLKDNTVQAYHAFIETMYGINRINSRGTSTRGDYASLLRTITTSLQDLP